MTCDRCLKGRHVRCEDRSHCSCSICRGPKPSAPKLNTSGGLGGTFLGKKDKPTKPAKGTGTARGSDHGRHAQSFRRTFGGGAPRGSRLQPKLVAAIAEDLRRGMSISATARARIVSRDQVRTILRDHVPNYTPTHAPHKAGANAVRKLDDRAIHIIRIMRSTGGTYGEIAECFGVSLMAVWYALNPHVDHKGRGSRQATEVRREEAA